MKRYESIDHFLSVSQDGKIVFIGGDYDHLALLRCIHDIVEDLNNYRRFRLYPIIAYQINIPFSEIYRQDMILLSNSDFAIFEISSSSGQLLELERARTLIEIRKGFNMGRKDLNMGIYYQVRDSKLALLEDILEEERTPGQVTSMITGFIDLYRSGIIHINGYRSFKELESLINFRIR